MTPKGPRTRSKSKAEAGNLVDQEKLRASARKVRRLFQRQKALPVLDEEKDATEESKASEDDKTWALTAELTWTEVKKEATSNAVAGKTLAFKVKLAIVCAIQMGVLRSKLSSTTRRTRRVPVTPATAFWSNGSDSKNRTAVIPGSLSLLLRSSPLSSNTWR